MTFLKVGEFKKLTDTKILTSNFIDCIKVKSRQRRLNMARIHTVVDDEEQRRKSNGIKPRPAFMEQVENKEEFDFESVGYKHTRAKQYVDKAFTSSTVHRLGSIYSVDSWPLKIILGVFFLTSAGYCMYQIVNTIRAFSSFGVLTTTSYNNEIPAEFPGKEI
jgi:hypothetical protein